MRTTSPDAAVAGPARWSWRSPARRLACPNCKEAVANQDGDAMRLANGYSWSILLMIAMPFALLGTGTLMVARAVRRGALPEL